jgi:hypothetical protein
MHLELLIGRQVLAMNGRSIGRIEELRAEDRGHGPAVSVVCIGPAALLERLSAPVALLIGRRQGYLARVNQIDFSDPKRPRLRVSVSELDRL